MWKTYKERISSGKKLKHTLNKEDREVLRNILWINREGAMIKETFNRLHKKYSKNEILVNPDQVIADKIYYLALNAPEETIFSYCEMYIDEGKRGGSLHLKKEADRFTKEIKEFFEIRGLLYDFEHNEEDDKIEIYPIASDKMRKRHTEVKKVLLREGWEKEASYISKSVSHFKKGENDYGASLKALYTALELSLKHTLSEITKKPKEEFENKNIAPIIDMLREEKFFDGAEADHIRHLSESIIKLSAFLGKIRKPADHSKIPPKEQVLFCIYGVDNCICYLVNHLKQLRKV